MCPPARAAATGIANSSVAAQGEGSVLHGWIWLPKQSRDFCHPETHRGPSQLVLGVAGQFAYRRIGITQDKGSPAISAEDREGLLEELDSAP